MLLDRTYLVLFETCPIGIGNLKKRLHVRYDVENVEYLDHLYQSCIFDLFLE